MEARAAVTRSAEWVQREYGTEKWPAIERLIAEVGAAEGGPPDPTRVVSQVARAEMGGLAGEGDVIVNGHVERLPLSLAWGAYQSLVVESVLARCGPETKLVVEMGSGWGRNLASLWLGGGPRDATYVAAEFTEAGRRATSELGRLIPGMRLEPIAFDYHQPDLGGVEPVEEAVVFSAHSVEQISELPEAFVPAVLGVAQRVTCLHFEPVGWQLDPSLAGSSREYAEHHDYNLNLIPLLGGQAEKGAIVLDETRPEVIGVNPSNATSLVAWSTAG
jgi:hypothetical protein